MTPWARTMKKRQEKGQCRRCHNPAAPKRTLCPGCLAIQATNRRQSYQQRKLDGKCVDGACPGKVVAAGRCLHHHEIYKAYQRWYKKKLRCKKPTPTSASTPP